MQYFRHQFLTYNRLNCAILRIVFVIKRFSVSIPFKKSKFCLRILFHVSMLSKWNWHMFKKTPHFLLISSIWNNISSTIFGVYGRMRYLLVRRNIGSYITMKNIYIFICILQFIPLDTFLWKCTDSVRTGHLWQQNNFFDWRHYNNTSILYE